MGKKATIQTVLSVLEKAAEDRDHIARDLHEHTQQDTQRFDAVTATLKEIGGDVKSLLDSRSFQRGAWKAITIIGGIAGTAASLIFAVVKHLWAG